MPISILPLLRRRFALALAALVACLFALAAGSALTAPAHAATRHSAGAGHKHRAKHARKHSRHAQRRRATAQAASKSQPPASAGHVTFGIYPGGAAGTVGPSGPVAPEDPAKRLAALEQLKPAGKAFVLHIYASYTGGSGYSAAAQVGADIASYTANGFQVELVLCYRPSDLNAAVDVPGFAAFVRDTVDQLGSNPGLVALQVTNEANVGGAPNASDGYYPGAKDALIDGVIMASYERTLDHDAQLKVGFNWAYATDSGEKAFWTYLGQHGGAAFLSALDWVGIDAYPGTWGPALATGVPFATAVRQATVQALSNLRQTYMPLAGIPASVPVHVSENGYPTGPGRTYAMQSSALQAMVHAVVDYSGTFNVSDYRWFDLRDADSSSTSFESQYGLMTDAYAPKPAFAVYQQLVASL